MRARILLVEDEVSLLRTLGDRLRSEGYDLVPAPSLAAADAALEPPPDLILLDLMLPDGDGMSWLRDLRRGGCHLPVLVLTARDRLEDTVATLRLGADDYLTKPFRTLELLARIESLLRRVDSRAAGSLRIGDLDLDLARGLLSRSGEPVELGGTELELLLHLARNPGRVVSREELLREVWGWAEGTRSRAVDQAVARLRNKIEPDRRRPRFLLTVHQRGYRLRL